MARPLKEHAKNRSEKIGVRVTKDVRAALVKAARRKRVSLSDLVHSVLEQFAERDHAA